MAYVVHAFVGVSLDCVAVFYKVRVGGTEEWLHLVLFGERCTSRKPSDNSPFHHVARSLLALPNSVWNDGSRLAYAFQMKSLYTPAGR